MTDIRMLLHEAAPEPLLPLDMTALRARARRRSMHRFAAWVAGVGVVITAAVPTGGAFLVNAAQGDRDQTVTAPIRSEDDAAEDTDTDASASPSGADSELSVPGGVGASAGDPGNPDATTTSAPLYDWQRDPDVTVADASYPRQSSCVIDNVGLGDGEQRRCRFTATTKGGADMSSSGTISPPPGAKGEVIVTRGDESWTRRVDQQEQRVGEAGTFVGCLMLEPGDQVEVILTNSTADPEDATITLGAGEGWECWSR